MSEPVFSYEANIQEVQQMLQELQEGKLSFDQSLALFKTAYQKIQACQTFLDQADLEIKQIMMQEDKLEEIDFE